MRKLIPLIFALVGAVLGIGAAAVLAPPKPADCAAEDAECQTAEAKPDKAKPGTEPEYVKLNNQFVVPVIAEDLVESLIVLSLSLEVDEGHSEAIYAREPKLRDTFLQTLFDFAHIGGFNGAFANSANLDRLKRDLTAQAVQIVGPAVHAVLIVDIVRQDI